MHTPPLSKTPDTVAFYERVIKRLENRAAEMVAAGLMDEAVDRNLQLALAVDDLAPFVTASTFRLYRAAVMYAIERAPGPFDYNIEPLLNPEPSENESIRQEELAQKREANLTMLRGAQQKATWLPAAEWVVLLKALRSSDSIWAQLAFDWVIATLGTGLRPCEWSDANWSGAKLIVNNAKATNERAHGPTRTLDLSRVEPAQRAVLNRFVPAVQSTGSSGFKGSYDGVRNLVRVVARRTFPGRKRYPTLYTARHTFAARAKATFNRETVAALMGHASLESAARHYASSKLARGGMPLQVEASFADIEAVRRANAARSVLKKPGEDGR